MISQQKFYDKFANRDAEEATLAYCSRLLGFQGT